MVALKYGEVRPAKKALHMAYNGLEKSYSVLEQKYNDLKFSFHQYNQRLSTKAKKCIYLGILFDQACMK